MNKVQTYPRTLATFRDLQGGQYGTVDLIAINRDTLEVQLGADYVHFNRAQAETLANAVDEFLECHSGRHHRGHGECGPPGRRGGGGEVVAPPVRGGGGDVLAPVRGGGGEVVAPPVRRVDGRREIGERVAVEITDVIETEDAEWATQESEPPKGPDR